MIGGLPSAFPPLKEGADHANARRPRRSGPAGRARCPGTTRDPLKPCRPRGPLRLRKDRDTSDAIGPRRVSEHVESAQQLSISEASTSPNAAESPPAPATTTTVGIHHFAKPYSERLRSGRSRRPRRGNAGEGLFVGEMEAGLPLLEDQTSAAAMR